MSRRAPRTAPAIVALFVLAACGGQGSGTAASTVGSSVPQSIVVSVPTTTTATTIEPCPPPTFTITLLPERAIGEPAGPGDIVLDRFTLIAGTTVQMWVDADGRPVVALIRGALPPQRWTAPPERIEVRGVEAALGPLPDGVWAVAWFDGPDRCDEYTLVLYPPTGPEEARAVAASLR